MKKNLFFISLCFSALIITINSCTKDDQEEIKEAVLGTMNASIGGVEWTADAPAAVVSSDRITVTGISGKQSITLTVETKTTGNYKITPNAITGAVYVANTDSASTKTYISTSGTLTVSDINTKSKRVSGSFVFKAFTPDLKDSISVSNGQFTYVKY